MKTFRLLLVLATGLVGLTSHAYLTEDQLGTLLLEENYGGVTQHYLDYYAQGPSGLNTSGGYHPGIDYRAQSPKTVYSPVSGVVANTYTPSGRVAVKIDGSNSYFLFLHLSSFAVSQGRHVAVGDTIGLTGSAGTSAAHLHVEFLYGKATASYYFKSRTATGVNSSPLYATVLDDKTKMTYVFNQLEKNYPYYFPQSQRSGATTYFNYANGFRYYRNSGNYLFLNTGIVSYEIAGRWYYSQQSLSTWYYGWGGR